MTGKAADSRRNGASHARAEVLLRGESLLAALRFIVCVFAAGWSLLALAAASTQSASVDRIALAGAWLVVAGGLLFVVLNVVVERLHEAAARELGRAAGAGVVPRLAREAASESCRGSRIAGRALVRQLRRASELPPEAVDALNDLLAGLSPSHNPGLARAVLRALARHGDALSLQLAGEIAGAPAETAAERRVLQAARECALALAGREQPRSGERLLVRPKGPPCAPPQQPPASAGA